MSKISESFEQAFRLSSAKLASQSLSTDVKLQTISRTLGKMGYSFHILITVESNGEMHRAMVLPQKKDKEIDIREALQNKDWVLISNTTKPQPKVPAAKTPQQIISVSGTDREEIIDNVFNALKEIPSGYTLYANVGPIRADTNNLVRVLNNRALKIS